MISRASDIDQLVPAAAVKPMSIADHILMDRVLATRRPPAASGRVQVRNFKQINVEHFKCDVDLQYNAQLLLSGFKRLGEIPEAHITMT